MTLSSHELINKATSLFFTVKHHLLSAWISSVCTKFNSLIFLVVCCKCPEGSVVIFFFLSQKIRIFFYLKAVDFYCRMS